MTRVGRGVHQVRELGSRLVRHGDHERHGSGGFKDLSALPVCGAGVRPLSSQRSRRTS